MLGGLGFDLAESLLDRFFGRCRPGPPRGESVEVTVEVPLERVLSGGRTARDPRFEREGADLWRTETIPIADAVLGTRLEVPTLDGAATVTVPPGTRPDTGLRLKGKGLPRFGERRRGDFYLRLRVRVPERLGPEERRLWERLRALGQSGAAAKP